jgi:hypothetical protein
MNAYGGFPNVDELRTAYERLQERMHAKCDEVERLREALEDAPKPDLFLSAVTYAARCGEWYRTTRTEALS